MKLASPLPEQQAVFEYQTNSELETPAFFNAYKVPHTTKNRDMKDLNAFHDPQKVASTNDGGESTQRRKVKHVFVNLESGLFGSEQSDDLSYNTVG